MSNTSFHKGSVFFVKSLPEQKSIKQKAETKEGHIGNVTKLLSRIQCQQIKVEKPMPQIFFNHSKVLDAKNIPMLSPGWTFIRGFSSRIMLPASHAIRPLLPPPPDSFLHSAFSLIPPPSTINAHHPVSALRPCLLTLPSVSAYNPPGASRNRRW